MSLTSLEKSMTGTSHAGDRDTVPGVGLSSVSLTNLAGILVGLDFLSSWTSTMWPTLIGEMGSGDIVKQQNQYGADE